MQAILKISLMSWTCQGMNIGMYHLNFELFLLLHPKSPPRPPPRSYGWADSYHFTISNLNPLKKTFATSLSFCRTLSKQIPSSYLPRILIHSATGGRHKKWLIRYKNFKASLNCLDSLTCERAANLAGQTNARHLLKVPSRLIACRNILNFEL